jgi:hypothetical protein
MPSLIPTSKGHPSLYCHAEKDLPKAPLPANDREAQPVAVFFRVLLLLFAGIFQNDFAPG